MSKKTLLAVALSLSAASAYADVVITTPEELVVLAINAQEIRGGLFGGTKNSYRLDAGAHQISVRYQQLFEENYINHDVVRSGVITLNTGELKDGANYHLALVNPPKDHDSAKDFAKQPSIALKNAAGEIVAQQQGATTNRQPWLANLFSGRNAEVDVRTAPTTETKSSAIAVQQPIQLPPPVAPSPAQSNNLSKDQQLVELWKTANSQERQRFMAWLAEQASK